MSQVPARTPAGDVTARWANFRDTSRWGMAAVMLLGAICTGMGAVYLLSFPVRENLLSMALTLGAGLVVAMISVTSVVIAYQRASGRFERETSTDD